MRLEGKKLGRYRPLHVIGGGSFGDVYLAEDMHLHRQLAIKVFRVEVISPPDSEEAKRVARSFEREMTAIAKLDHPHILPLFDYGQEIINKITFNYLVMPFCKEGSFAEWLKKRGNSQPLSLEETVHFICQAANALQFAHDRDIIHKDVKPHNFLIRNNSENLGLPDLLLADFGIAKLHTATYSTGNKAWGTPYYMPPEQWNEKPVFACDQYALAVMTYQLLTGRPPFQGNNEQVMLQHFNTPPVTPSALNSEIPSAVDTVILQALAKKPEDRFVSISQFAEALKQAAQSIRKGNDIYMVLALNEAEALVGTECSLILPNGEKVTVPISPGTKDGETILLEKHGEKSSYGGPNGDLIVTILMKPDITSDQIVRQLDSLSKDIAALQNNSDDLSSKNVILQPNANNQKTTRFLNWADLSLLVLLLSIIIVGANVGLFFIFGINAHNIIQAPFPPKSGTLALVDPLIDNSKGFKWDEYSFSNPPLSCKFTGGTYHAISTAQTTFASCTARAKDFSNFAFRIEMTIIQGDCGGLFFRSDASNEQFYFFEVCQDGTYRLISYTSASKGEGVILINLQEAAAIHTGLNQTNTIAVVADGNSLDLYVNDQKINSVQDSTYSHGEIGVVAFPDTRPTEVVYSYAKVWTF